MQSLGVCRLLVSQNIQGLGVKLRKEDGVSEVGGGGESKKKKPTKNKKGRSLAMKSEYLGSCGVLLDKDSSSSGY